MSPPGLFPRRAGVSVLAVALLVLAASGCGNRTGTVSGKVFYQGKPLPGGNVNFMSEGPSATVKSSTIQSDGSYSVSGVPVGLAKITVQGLAQRRLAEFKGQGGSTEQREQKEIFVPPHYGNAELSGLQFDVKPGSQSHDIELKDTAPTQR
jgi:hypothetical protein